MIVGQLNRQNQSLYGQISSEKESMTGNISVPSRLFGTISVSVIGVPYYEVSNIEGGTTVYIGNEVINHGSK